MELLDKEQKVRQEIFDYFGYVEDWRVLPFEDYQKYFWRHNENLVHFADSVEELDNEDGNHYVVEIYKQRHLPRWVYPGKEYTMIVIDTHTDGNKFLGIFSNSKKQ